MTDENPDETLARVLGQGAVSGIAGMFGGRGAQQSSLNVVIHNNAGASVSASESGSFDRKMLEITIDQMVANSLSGGRETTGVLRSLFGITPVLLGR